MLSNIFDFIFGYLKGKSYWPKVEPVVTLVALYIVTVVFAYQYIEWRYHFSPPVQVFARSYIVKQLTLVFLTIAILGLVLGISVSGSTQGRWTGVAYYLRTAAKRLAVAGVVLVLMLGLFLRLTPHKVSHITIKYLDEPSFNKYAFTYIVYELNRSQPDWHFILDFDTFNPDVLSSGELSKCDGDRLCYAHVLAKDKGFVGITTERLGADFFWQNSGNVSVVSVHDWEQYAPPSVYEYLAYSLIVQSTLIHLNRHCSGLPQGSFQQGRVAYGDLFEFSPRRNEMKAAILAAHLSPRGEELLANCFGMEYMTTCNRLLALDWLRSGRVRENLEKDFGAKF